MLRTFTNFPSTKGSKLTEISFIWSSRISPFGFFSWNNKMPRGLRRQSQVSKLAPLMRCQMAFWSNNVGVGPNPTFERKF
jgi:hypothetical protein